MKQEMSDKNLRNQINKYESKVDLDKLWNSIEPEIGGKSAGGSLWLKRWYLLLLPPLLLSSFLFLNKETKHENNNEQSIFASNSNGLAEEISFQNAPKVAAETNKILNDEGKFLSQEEQQNSTINEEEKVTSNKIINEEKTTTEPNTLNTKLNSNIVNAKNNNSSKKSYKPALKVAKKNNQNSNQLNSKNTIETTNIYSNNNFLNTFDSKNYIVEEYFENPITASVSEDLEIENNAISESEITSSFLNNEIENANTKTAIAERRKYITIDLIQSINPFESTYKKLSKERIEMQKIKIGKYYKESAFRYFVNTSVGIGASIKSLKTANSDFEILTSLRKQSERVLETTNFDLSFGAEHEKNIALIAGLNYSEINERYTYNLTTIVDTTVYGIIRYEITLGGDTLPIYGNRTDKVQVQSQQTNYNKYRFINIPIGLEYQTKLSDFWKLGIHFGTLVNLNLSTSGTILTSTESIIDIEEMQIEMFKDRIELSYFTNLNFNYELNKKVSIQLSPNFRFMSKPINAGMNEIDQKYSTISVNAGIRYYLND